MLVDDLRAVLESGELSARIGGLDDVVEVRQLLDRIEGQWFAAVHDSDVRGDAHATAALSTGDYLARECGLTTRDGRAMATMAKRLRWAESVGGGLRDGSVSLGQARSFTRALSKRNISLFCEHEDTLLDLAKDLSVDQLDKAMDHWRRRADSELSDQQTKNAQDNRELFISPLGDNQWIMKGSLTAEQGSIINEALKAVVEAEWDHSAETRTMPQRRSDALTTICRNWLATNHDITVHANRPQLQVHVQLNDLLALSRTQSSEPSHPRPFAGGYTNDGSFLDAATIERLWCDSVISRVLLDGSVLLEAGRASRTIPVGLRRAVIARDRHCRYPGCTCTATWCEVHHIKEWNDNGNHDIKNLVLLCSRHHQRIHTTGEKLVLLDDGTLIVTNVRDEEHRSHPPPNIGRLFNSSLSKRDRDTITEEQTRHHKRIANILNALNHHDNALNHADDIERDNIDAMVVEGVENSSTHVDGDNTTAHDTNREGRTANDARGDEETITEQRNSIYVPGRVRHKSQPRKTFPGIVLHYRHQIINGTSTIQLVA